MPLGTASVATAAVRPPATTGSVENVTINWVGLAAVTLTHRTVIKGHRIVGHVRIEAEATDGDARGIGRQIRGVQAHDRCDSCHLSRRAVENAIHADNRGQISRGERSCGECNRERSRTRRRHGADRAVVEGDRVVGLVRIEAETAYGNAQSIGSQIRGVLSHNRHYRGYFNRCAAAHGVRRDRGCQASRRDRPCRECNRERGRTRRRHAADCSIVERYRVVGLVRVESEAVDGDG